MVEDSKLGQVSTRTLDLAISDIVFIQFSQLVRCLIGVGIYVYDFYRVLIDPVMTVGFHFLPFGSVPDYLTRVLSVDQFSSSLPGGSMFLQRICLLFRLSCYSVLRVSSAL